VRTRDAAEPLRDVYLEMDAALIPPLPVGSFYWHEFVGVVVTDPAGAPLGIVRDVYRSGGAEILVVEEGPRGAFDLPIAAPFVSVLAPREGRIVADPVTLDLPDAAPLKPPAPARPPRPRRATRRRPAVPMPPPRPREQGVVDGVDGATAEAGAEAPTARADDGPEPSAAIPAE
jgi:hypothetical protein